MILEAGEPGILVACGGPAGLLVRRLVPEGRRGMAAAEFLRGHALCAASRFGPAEPPATEAARGGAPAGGDAD
jgi:hypothetical protein